MEALIAFWTHALAAALFASLTLWELRRGVGESEQRMLLAAFALTACWAWITAMAPTTMLAAYSETARNLVWVGVLYRLAGIDSSEEQRGVRPVYAAVAGGAWPAAGGRCPAADRRIPMTSAPATRWSSPRSSSA